MKYLKLMFVYGAIAGLIMAVVGAVFKIKHLTGSAIIMKLAFIGWILALVCIACLLFSMILTGIRARKVR